VYKGVVVDVAKLAVLKFERPEVGQRRKLPLAKFSQGISV
jgi:hypothetical protein